MCKKMIHVIFLVLVLVLAQGQARGAYLAVYWDENYPDHWINAGDAATVRDGLADAGYEVLDADQLKSWMDDRIADGAPSVVVFSKDVAPETVAETNTADCTLRQYLDAGGKIVFYGDIPFWNQGNPGGGETNWSASGSTGILGFHAAGATWDTSNTVQITEDGEEWGLTETWASVRPATPGDVDIVLATDNSGAAAAWVKNYVPGETHTGFVRIWDRGNIYSLDDLMRVAEYGLGGGGNPLARRPDPEDGALLSQTWGTLSWRPGFYAVSHDFYIGTNLDDVNDGAADTFVGNLPTAMQIVGFAGFPLADGLVPGTTYYWRVDEVNDANAASPWKGDVWSFSIPPKTGYNPSPAEGSKFIATEDLALSWTAGFEAKLHTVYFGDNFDEIDAAAGGLPQAFTTFTPPGPLEPEKTYYWRVDEFDVVATHKGPVWSFTTAGEGGGVKGQYFQGMSPGGTPALTRTDPQINFSWGSGGPDPLVGDDDFSCRWTGEVEAAFTETYTFYTNSDDGVRLWIDGQQLVNNWTDHGTTENNGKIDLVAGQTYSLVMEFYENGGGAVAELRWSSPSTPKQLIPQAALSFLVHANNASPANGTEGVNLMSNLMWGPGDFASSHEVYLGTDADAVANATKASPEYQGSKALGEESLDPGKLAFDTTYFWRVDEVNNTNPDSPWAGNVWSFWTGDFLVVDDFELYNDIDPPAETSNRIFDKWIDGFGTTDNGALIGNDLPPYAEQTIVNSGAQSMIYRYDNANKTSEATLTLVYPKDWTEEGVTKLSLSFRGATANSADRMFVALGNSVVYHPDAAATQTTGWNEWVIDLTEFAGVDLTNVGSIAIGIGTKGSPAADGGTGTMYFDDVRLIQ
ncbi:MAG: PA14 domain-containing protein [Planctomycetota bacterium]